MSATGTHDVAPRMVLVVLNGPFHTLCRMGVRVAS